MQQATAFVLRAFLWHMEQIWVTMAWQLIFRRWCLEPRASVLHTRRQADTLWTSADTSGAVCDGKRWNPADHRAEVALISSFVRRMRCQVVQSLRGLLRYLTAKKVLRVNLSWLTADFGDCGGCRASYNRPETHRTGGQENLSSPEQWLSVHLYLTADMKQTFQSQIKVRDVAATVTDVQLLCFTFFLLLKTTCELHSKQVHLKIFLN